MKRVAALVVAMALAGCGSTVANREELSEQAAIDSTTGEPGLDDGGPVAGETTGPSGRAATVTTVLRRSASAATSASGTPKSGTGPVTVGFLNTKTGNAAAFGLNVGENYPPRQVFEALVKQLNARGGLAGRRIVPVVADTDTASASWESDYQAACEKLTHDQKVDAVVGYSFGLFDNFESCLTKARIPHLSGGYAVGDSQTFVDYPYLVATTNPTADRRFRLQLEAPFNAGILNPEHRIGLLVDECPEHDRAYKRTMLPFIQSKRLTVAAEARMSCAHGASDVTGIAAQIQNAALLFRSRNVDTVVTEGIPVVVFATQAESQGWRPRYLLTSTSGGAALGPNVPPGQAANMFGFGWFPAVDVAPGTYPFPSTATRRCFDLLKAEGITPSQYNDFVGATTTCDGLFLYEAALQATKGAADGPSVVAAVASLGPGYQAASTLDGRAAFNPRRRDAPAAYRPFGWDGGCSCFVYKGPTASWG